MPIRSQAAADPQPPTAEPPTRRRGVQRGGTAADWIASPALLEAVPPPVRIKVSASLGAGWRYVGCLSTPIGAPDIVRLATAWGRRHRLSGRARIRAAVYSAARPDLSLQPWTRILTFSPVPGDGAPLEDASLSAIRQELAELRASISQPAQLDPLAGVAATLAALRPLAEVAISAFAPLVARVLAPQAPAEISASAFRRALAQAEELGQLRAIAGARVQEPQAQPGILEMLAGLAGQKPLGEALGALAQSLAGGGGHVRPVPHDVGDDVDTEET